LDSWQFEAVIYDHDLPKRTAVRSMKLFVWVPALLGLLAWQLPTSPLVSALPVDAQWLGWALPNAFYASLWPFSYLVYDFLLHSSMGGGALKSGNDRFGDAFAEVVREVREAYD
jgi:hypothetical protein